MGGKAFDVIIAIVWVALVFVLVRPGSQGPGLVTSITDGLSGLVGKATGGGTWSGK